MDAVVLFFVLGALAGWLKADLRLPPAVYELVSAILLLAIGLKGGVELSRHLEASLLWQCLAVIGLGVTLTLLAFAILRGIGRIARPDAAAIAAHYGSVSVATFAVGSAYLVARGTNFEGQVALFLALLEIPGILVGIWLGRAAGAQTRWQPLLREALLGRSVVLLVGALLIGWIAGADGIKPIAPLFVDLFKGVLALFLLEMGLIAADQFASFRRHGAFLAAFAVVVPLCFSVLGAALGDWLGLSVGGVTLMATLAASASYIAAPAAVRTGIPEANAGLSLTAVLGITFPFNILIGIPLYERMARWMVGDAAGG
jgi:hypothetical protein